MSEEKQYTLEELKKSNEETLKMCKTNFKLNIYVNLPLCTINIILVIIFIIKTLILKQ